MNQAEQSRRDSLIDEYRDYVHFIVGKLIQTMNLPQARFEEFVASGYLGLVEAADRFDFSSGIQFKHFAFLRIRGAIIDSIRECSELSGKAYRYARALQAAQELRESSAGKLAGDAQPERIVGEILQYVAQGGLAYRLSMADAEEELSCAATENNPEQRLADKEERSLFRRLVSELPDKERLIIEEYYFNNKPFAQIARESGSLSKSWISRLHTRALAILKKRYLEHMHVS